MPACPACYQSHGKDVEICDCGHRLLPLPETTIEWWELVYGKACCPHCAHTNSTKIRYENAGWTKIDVMLHCKTCKNLFEIQHFGIPSDTIYLAVAIIVGGPILIVMSLMLLYILVYEPLLFIAIIAWLWRLVTFIRRLLGIEYEY